MELYTGFDLHANNSYAGIINADGKREARKRLPNDIGQILQFLEPYKAQMVGIVVESTYNWYWLVDGLMEAGYRVHLANTTAIQKYSGMKHSDDKENKVTPYMEGNQDLEFVGQVSKDTIDFLSAKIRVLESFVEDRAKLNDSYANLLTIPGVGKILGLTIMLETGSLDRFEKVGNYASYSRKVSTKWTSNEKKKGRGNKKNGNKYLAWAFSEAAEFARRYDQQARTYYSRKLQKTNFMVAHNALAHKLARAAYHVMKEQTPFMPEKLFAS